MLLHSRHQLHQPLGYKMSSSQSDSYKDERITLPPIRDILRDELGSSPRSTSRALGPSFSGPMRSALPDYPSSRAPSSQSKHEHHAQRLAYNRAYDHHSASRSTPPPGPYAYPNHASMNSSGRPAYEAYPTNAHHGHGNMAMHHSRSHAEAYRSSPAAQGHMSSAHWDKHRRQDSTDSAWSNHSSPQLASSHHARQHTNALHFQPLPHASTTGQNARQHGAPSGSERSGSSAPIDFQSPFGVLIADVDPQSVAPSDPQRMAILRTLKASGQSSFPLNFDDPRNSIQTARYQCEYCLKRFTRPSSLKIHIHSHTGEKPYECTFEGCGRRFSVQSNMRRHARVHEGGARKVGESSGDEAEEASPEASPRLNAQ